MGRSLGKDTYRPPAQTARDARVPGARSSFVLRRMRFARLLPVSLLLAVLTATIARAAEPTLRGSELCLRGIAVQ